MKFLPNIPFEYDGAYHFFGGPGSGHWGHAGRKGKRGGSVARGGLDTAINLGLERCLVEGEKIKGEFGITLDAAGKTLLEHKGEEFHVIYPDKLPDDAFVTLHNHPTEGTFSGGDVTWLMNNEQLGISAVIDPTKTVYRLEKTDDTPTAKQLYPDKISPSLYLQDDIQKVFDDVFRRDLKAKFSGEPYVERTLADLKEEFVQEIAPIYHLKYSSVVKNLSEPYLALREMGYETALQYLIEHDYHFRTDGSKVVILGGAGSGNFGHKGRPGQVGGSTSSGGLVIGRAEVAEFTKDSKFKELVYRGGSERARERMIGGDFAPEKAGSNVWQGSAIYTTPQEWRAAKFGDAIPIAVDLRNPFVGTGEEIGKKIDTFKVQAPEYIHEGVNTGVRMWVTPGQQQAAIREAWIGAGYDGLLQKSGARDEIIVVAAFNPESIRVVENTDF